MTPPAHSALASSRVRTAQVLGWRTTSLDSGLAHTIAWHRQQTDSPGGGQR